MVGQIRITETRSHHLEDAEVLAQDSQVWDLCAQHSRRIHSNRQGEWGHLVVERNHEVYEECATGLRDA